MFAYSDGSWLQRGDAIVSTAAGDACGYSVSLSSDGSVVAIGLPWNKDNDDCSGHVRVLAYSNA